MKVLSSVIVNFVKDQYEKHPNAVKSVVISGLLVLLGFIGGSWYESLLHIDDSNRQQWFVGKDGLKYIKVPAGIASIGCLHSSRQSRCESDEFIMFDYVSNGFWMSEVEVTRRAYEKVTLGKISDVSPSLPQVNISWDAAKQYCEKIGGRLPSEAEWEYAARAGVPIEVQTPSNIHEYVFESPEPGGLRKTKLTKSNDFGLYDMLGNVKEWTIAQHPAKEGPYSYGTKGGAYTMRGEDIRFGDRSFLPGYGASDIGFRCVVLNRDVNTPRVLTYFYERLVRFFLFWKQL